jgi:cellulose biosynthesis protein BcsQ
LTQTIAPHLHLVPGDLGLARFEDDLSLAWTAALGANPFRPFRLLSAFWQIAQMAARQHEADLVLVDVGPNLGALNRSALIATDHVIIPLAADLFSIQGLRNLGPTLTEWRGGWKRRLDNWPAPTFELPLGSMHPAGYVLMQHSERLSRPVKAFEKWAQRIPSTYLNDILDQESARPETVSDDVNCLALIKHYRSLVPMAQEARKPIFRLTSADGAIGNHSYAVRDSRTDFEKLALAILRATHLSVG